MKKRRNGTSLSQHPLGWSLLVLTLAFASLAIAFLISQNDDLTARISALESTLATEREANAIAVE